MSTLTTKEINMQAQKFRKKPEIFEATYEVVHSDE